jgi:hypothetical protein
MDALKMLQLAVWLFAIAALGGLVMAGIRFGGKRNPPAWLAMLHGLLAAAGLTLVLYAAAFAQDVADIARIGAGLLLAAAGGGVWLNLGYRWKDRLLPGLIVIGHAVLAVVGFGCIVIAAYR